MASQQKDNVKNLPFWLITIGIIIVLTLPILVKDGMFMDAMLYTSVAHNLSQGIGTFWFPQFSYNNMSGLTSFHEQPSLGLGIQACFFKLFGSGMYTERIYTFLMLVMAVWLIVLLWKEIYRSDNELQKQAWLPLLLWITIPVCYWSYCNNMMENTMNIFVLPAVLFSYRSCKANKDVIVYVFLSGLCIFLASLTKGLPGLFPIVIPFIYWLTIGNITFRRVFTATLILVGIPLLLYSLLMLYPESKDSLTIYFTKRVLGRIQNEPVVSSRLSILWQLFMNMLPQLGLAAIVLIIAKRKQIRTEGIYQKTGLFFVITGLAGTLPLMATLVQKGFYMVPALPYFAIGLAMYMGPYTKELVETISNQRNMYRIISIAGIVILCFSLGFTISQIGKTSRNKELLHDVYAIGKIVPDHSVVAIPNNSDMWNEWDLQCYLMRYYNISIDPNKPHIFYVDNVNHHGQLPEKYKLVAHLEQYDLFKEDSVRVK